MEISERLRKFLPKDVLGELEEKIKTLDNKEMELSIEARNVKKMQSTLDSSNEKSKRAIKIILRKIYSILGVIMMMAVGLALAVSSEDILFANIIVIGVVILSVLIYFMVVSIKGEMNNL